MARADAGMQSMGRLDRYILVTAGGAFFAALSTLTGMVWLTQILRRFDLVTSPGQTIRVFFMVTGLALPTLVLLIAPMALFLAITYTLNKLNGDSELIVMSAAGLSQWQLFRPFFLFSLAVTAVSAYLSIDGAPGSTRMLRDQIAVVNADVISNVAQPGRFAALERGLTFHIRDRAPGGILLGIFVHDSRDPKRSRLMSPTAVESFPLTPDFFWFSKTARYTARRRSRAAPRWSSSRATPSTCRNSSRPSVQIRRMQPIAPSWICCGRRRTIRISSSTMAASASNCTSGFQRRSTRSSLS
jgi:lipopolysaccharide export LptBFGC system permease protein LptF